MSRLVVMTRGLPLHHVGGMESVAWDVARALAAGGSPVTVVTTSVPGRGPRFELDGVEVRAAEGTAPGRYSRAWWRQSRRVLDGLLREEPVAGVLSVSAAAFGCLDLARRGTPGRGTAGRGTAGGGPRFVMQAHGTSVMELRSKLASGSPRAVATSVRNVRGLARDLRCYRRFDAVVAVGPSVAESLASFPLGRWAGVPPVRTVVNGVDAAAFAPDPAAAAALRASLGVPAGAGVLLSAGRLHRQKRVDRAVRCLRALRGPDGEPAPHLVVVGGGPEEGSLRELAASLGVAERVHFAGPVPRESLAAYYAAADLTVLTSQWREGLPMSVLESLACGTPALTPLSTVAVEGAEDVVGRVDAADAGALAAAVDAALARRARGHRRSLLPDRYDLRRVAQEYDALLRGTIT